MNRISANSLALKILSETKFQNFHYLSQLVPGQIMRLRRRAAAVTGLRKRISKEGRDSSRREVNSVGSLGLLVLWSTVTRSQVDPLKITSYSRQKSTHSTSTMPPRGSWC